MAEQLRVKCREDSSVARELTQAGSLADYSDEVITLIIHELTKVHNDVINPHDTLAGFCGKSYSADGRTARIM